jgi:hypothetical protein
MRRRAPDAAAAPAPHDRRVPERSVTADRLGAWVLKGNADRTDLAERFAASRRVDRWCVRPGYRARLMAAGQPVVLWVSGSRGRLPSGICGVGRLTGPAVRDPADGGWGVGLELTVLEPEAWVPRQVLTADPRLAAAEVFRQPQGANPSFLTVAELAAVREHLDA